MHSHDIRDVLPLSSLFESWPKRARALIWDLTPPGRPSFPSFNNSNFKPLPTGLSLHTLAPNNLYSEPLSLDQSPWAIPTRLRQALAPCSTSTTTPSAFLALALWSHLGICHRLRALSSPVPSSLGLSACTLAAPPVVLHECRVLLSKSMTNETFTEK